MSVFNDLQVDNDFYGVTTTKGDLIVNDGIKNASLGIGADNYVLTADSTQPLGLKWAAATGGGGSGNILYNQYVLTSLPVATNNTTPVPITEFTSTPVMGNYVALMNLTFSLSMFNRNATFGLYKNGILIANSSRTVGSFISFLRSTFSTSFITTFNGTDIFTVRFNTDNLDTNLVIYEGTLILIKFSNIAQYAITNSDFTTNYTTPVIIANTTDTPALGIYLVSFNCIFYMTLNNRTMTIGFYKDGLLIPGTTRTLSSFEMIRTVFEYNHIISFSGIEVLTVRVNISNIDTDIVISDRNLMLITI
jgi:hypothetical protein